MNTHTEHAEHTPGPWSVSPLPESTWNVTHKIDSREAPVAIVSGEDNARLIAAAPDLLKALETIAKTNGGRWLDSDGNECQETDEGARWEEYTPEEQIRWLESCAQLAAEAIARAKNA